MIPNKLIGVFCVLSLLLLRDSEAVVSCSDTATCEELYRPGSVCSAEGGICTNPFHDGCLRNYLGDDRYPKRICNSHDNDDGAHCIPPLFPDTYQEIRIASQNWESAMFTAWILQILLSELLGVPASIESSGPGKNVNFYDLHNSFDYGAMGYDFNALQKASEIGDCRLRYDDEEEEVEDEEDDDEKDDDDSTTSSPTLAPTQEYISCAHVIPEVWSGQRDKYIQAEADGFIEPPEGSGAIGKLFWAVPRYTVENDPTLLSSIGMQGQMNRRKVAESFKRPTNWKDYCAMVSKNNCTEDDGIAVRAPESAGEETRFHVAGLFKGHFRKTSENDCDVHPKSCKGHITDLPCDWQTYVQAQVHHLQIPVESAGPLEPNGAYTYGNLMDIWAAANATKKNVLYYWWLPDPMYNQHLGTDSEFTFVQLPRPSQECVSHRVSASNRCSANLEDRIGDPVGSCDPEAQSLLKLVASNIFDTINRQSDVKRSPAYEGIKGLSVSELQLGQIFDYWYELEHDHWNYDPREATCRWFAENLDYLETLIPRSYPRMIQTTHNYDKAFFRSAIVLGSLVAFVIVVTGILTFKYRESPVMKFAQVGFLYLLLGGLFLVALGSISLAVEPSAVSCPARAWFVTLGYTLELVPLIIKVAAINSMMQAAKRMKRINLTQKDLYVRVLSIVSIVLLYLIVWTAVDPPTSNDAMDLTDRTITVAQQHGYETDNNNNNNNNGDNHTTTHNATATTQGDYWNQEQTVITLIHFCSSNNIGWYYASISWRVILLTMATVLAFQTRNLREDFNESQTMAIMIYSHFIFVSLQVVTFALEGSLQQDTLEACRGVIYSIDALVAIQIYFVPKLYKAIKKIDVKEAEERRRNNMISNLSRAISRPGIDSSFSRHHDNSRENSFSESCADDLNPNNNYIASSFASLHNNSLHNGSLNGSSHHGSRNGSIRTGSFRGSFRGSAGSHQHKSTSPLPPRPITRSYSEGTTPEVSKSVVGLTSSKFAIPQLSQNKAKKQDAKQQKATQSEKDEMDDVDADEGEGEPERQFLLERERLLNKSKGNSGRKMHGMRSDRGGKPHNRLSTIMSEEFQASEKVFEVSKRSLSEEFTTSGKMHRSSAKSFRTSSTTLRDSLMIDENEMNSSDEQDLQEEGVQDGGSSDIENAKGAADKDHKTREYYLNKIQEKKSSRSFST